MAVAVHQFVRSADRVLTAWKGGGFGMYTTPHGLAARATFLIVDGHPLRLAPEDPDFSAWVASVDPASGAYLGRMQAIADRMRTYPRTADADALIASAARIVWDKSLFDTWTDPGQQPRSAIEVVVTEIARRPSEQVIESRIVFSRTGE